VNVAAKTIDDERYLEEIAQALRETGADPSRLIFEASEQMAVADLNRARRFAEQVHELTGGGAAVVYDGVGRATFDESLAALRPRGFMVLYGAASGQPDSVPIPKIQSRSLYLTRPQLHQYTATREELLERARDVFEWVREGKLKVEIGGRYSLEDARRAQEDLESRRTTGKLILLPRG
jgi:NADPH2:quinone reductase